MNNDAHLREQLIDAIRLCLGKEPLYRPLQEVAAPVPYQTLTPGYQAPIEVHRAERCQNAGEPR